MKPRFIGKLCYADMDPLKPEDEFVLAADFGLVTSDQMLCIAPVGTRVDGASFPWITYPVLGDPLSRKNRFWSVHHDAGYDRAGRVVDLAAALEYLPTVDDSFAYWDSLPDCCFDHKREETRAWWDHVGMMDAMRLMHVKRWRRYAILAGVRSPFGALTWWREGR